MTAPTCSAPNCSEPAEHTCDYCARPRCSEHAGLYRAPGDDHTTHTWCVDREDGVGETLAAKDCTIR